jgi:hypothetical protein
MNFNYQLVSIKEKGENNARLVIMWIHVSKFGEINNIFPKSIRVNWQKDTSLAHCIARPERNCPDTPAQ